VSLTNLLIIVNVVAFVWELATGGPDYDHGYLIGAAVVEHGQWWRIFTAAFLHGSIPHVALNMLALYQVGNLVERLFGKLRFALLYALSIVGSGIAVIWFNYNQPTLGASGAIFGLFGALVAVGLRLGPRGRALIGQVVPIVALNLVFTFAVPGISAAAHVGGLITGFIVGFGLFMMPSRERERAYAYAFAPPPDPYGTMTIDQQSEPEPPLPPGEHERAEPPPHPGPHG
jgi:membrane associated rhomboid family serine protease